jgi:hypothetical protein
MCWAARKKEAMSQANQPLICSERRGMAYAKYVGSSAKAMVSGKRKLNTNAHVGRWTEQHVRGDHGVAEDRFGERLARRGNDGHGDDACKDEPEQVFFHVARENLKRSKKRLPSALYRRTSRKMDTKLARDTTSVHQRADSSQAGVAPVVKRISAIRA